MSTGPPTLRERRRVALSREISDVALTLFEKHGSAGTTVDGIAEAAGISQRTFFRYFARKEDAAFWNAILNEDRILLILDEAIAATRAGAHPLSAMLQGWSRIYDDFETDETERRNIRRQARLINRDEEVAAVGQQRENRIIELAVERLRDALGSELDSVLPRTAVKLAFTISRVTFDEWARLHDLGHTVDLGSVHRQVIDAVQDSGDALPTSRARSKRSKGTR